MSDPSPIHVSAMTMERVRFGARLHACSYGAFVDEAVREYVESHREELAAGFAHVREVLGLDG